MKQLIAVGIVAFVCLGAAHAQELDGEAKKKLALAGAALGKAINEHDIPALEKLWSPKLLVNGPNNHVLTRLEVFDAIKRGELNYEGSYKSTLEKIEFFGNVAVTMGEDTYTPDFGPEKGKTIHRRSTNVWQYADGTWMMIARQATIYDPEAKHY
ncbi:MAG TPA: nuclear transport factor 2 family protein [Terriglobus sp.]